MPRCLSLSIVTLLLIPGVSLAQSLVPAGQVNGQRFAIDLGDTAPATDGQRRVTLYEAPEHRSAEVRYAVVTAYVDCQAGARTDRIREEFSSLRDPIKTVYSPPRVVAARESDAVASQIAVLCSDAGTRQARQRLIDLGEFLDR